RVSFVRSYLLLLFLVSCVFIPPPPRSTLFPYTTLFRSGRDGRRPRAVPGRHPPRAAARDRVPRARGALPGLPAAGRGPRRPAGLDRKSTRLNSSHQIISYAVFCLKKKNKEEKLATSHIN